ncbi:unnamed protein product [Camellia sinensis]
MELMVSLMCEWLKKLIKSKHDVVDVVDLLLDMNCVGLKPNFSMIEKVISLYWDMGKNERAVLFVKEVLRREIAYREDGMEGHKGGPTGYLAWKMMAAFMVHERLLAMYICAGRGLEAERQLWGMKLVGKEADGDLYDIVLAICASQKEAGPIAQLMSRMRVASSEQQ